MHAMMRLMLAAFLAGLLAALAGPAQACGCGGYIAPDGNAAVAEEKVLLRWDGQTEQLVMSLGVLGSSSEAAVVLPVPAQAQVELGDARIWEELGALTRPLVVHEKRYVFPFGFGGVGSEAMPGSAGGGAMVTELSRQTLGPFQVSVLSAGDAAALGDWLNANGYTLSPGLAKTFEPYVTQGWYYVAVRLKPGSGPSLTGALDPLKVTFPAKALVYPMRSSAHSSVDEAVTIYVLADHEVVKDRSFGYTHTGFADWVAPADVAAAPAVAPFVDRRLFLTKFEDRVMPAQVDGDFNFTLAPQDYIHHDTVTVYDDDYSLVYASLICLGLLLLAPFVALAGLVVFLVRRRKPAAG
jgi:hypothetical protein